MKNNISLAAVAAAVLIAPLFALAAPLTQTLDLGDSNSDVTSLQTFLSADANIYPSKLVTGYFGQLTKAGVERFQTQSGIISNGTPETTGYGRVGPTTLAAINAQMSGGTPTGDTTAPLLSAINVSAGSNSVAIAWNTSEQTRAYVYYSTSPLSEYEYPKSVTIGGSVVKDESLNTSHNVTINGLQANTTYYYDVYVTDASGNASMTVQTTFRTTN